MLAESFDVPVERICGGGEKRDTVGPTGQSVDDFAEETVVAVAGMGEDSAREEQKVGDADGRCVIHGDSISEKQSQTLK
jgi:hypothetical protein